MCFNPWWENNDCRTDYKGKYQVVTGMFLDVLCKTYIPSNDVVQEKMRWWDGSTSEFDVLYYFFNVTFAKLKHNSFYFNRT